MSASANTNDNNSGGDGDQEKDSKLSLTLDAIIAADKEKKKRRGAVKRRWDEEPLPVFSLDDLGKTNRHVEGAQKAFGGGEIGAFLTEVTDAAARYAARHAASHGGRFDKTRIGYNFFDVPEKPRQRPEKLAREFKEAQQAMAATGYRFDEPDAYEGNDQLIPIVPPPPEQTGREMNDRDNGRSSGNGNGNPESLRSNNNFRDGGSSASFRDRGNPNTMPVNTDARRRREDARHGRSQLQQLHEFQRQQRQRLEEELREELKLRRNMEAETAVDIDELADAMERKEAELSDAYQHVGELRRVNDDLLRRLKSQAPPKSSGASTSTPSSGTPGLPGPSTAGTSKPASSIPRASWGSKQPSKRRRIDAGTRPVDNSGLEWNQLMNSLCTVAHHLRPLEIAALQTKQKHIFRAVVEAMADPVARENVFRLFAEPPKRVWYCFTQLAAHGPRFTGAVVQEPAYGGVPTCPAHPHASCLQMRLATETELRRGGGKVVWRGD
ncbi:hypothetical protein PG985_010410 [Apiospora marii]|uniref:uncharacterized protein n=1 Tax=Apiospora marii TaxID=335849 RepID=UPI00312E4638